jgi:hypothetical protein
MPRVLPIKSQPGSEEKNIIFYDNLFKGIRGNIAVIVIEGFLSQGNNDPNEEGYRVQSSINYYYQWYDTKGLLRDFLTLRSDIKKTGEGSRSDNREDRLNSLVDKIKKQLQNKEIQKLVLIGLSHGSLIMYSALAKVEADTSIEFNLLKKLYFYAVSPPTVLPNNVLSYNEKTDPDTVDAYKTREQNIIEQNICRYLLGQKKPDGYFSSYRPPPNLKIKSPPPYMQIHYINDQLFIEKSGASFLIEFIKNNILKKIRAEFRSYPSKDFTPINKSFYMKENDLFYEKKDHKKIIMLYKPEFSIPEDTLIEIENTKQYNQEFQNFYDIKSTFYFWRFYRVTKVIQEKEQEYHAMTDFLYIFLYYSDIDHFIKDVLGFFKPTPPQEPNALKKLQCFLKDKFKSRAVAPLPPPPGASPPGAGGNPKDKVHKVNKVHKVHLLGKSRKIITKGRWQYIKYKNELITIHKAKQLEQRLKNKSANR